MIPNQPESTEERSVISTKRKETAGGISFTIQAELMCNTGSSKDDGPGASTVLMNNLKQ